MSHFLSVPVSFVPGDECVIWMHDRVSLRIIHVSFFMHDSVSHTLVWVHPFLGWDRMHDSCTPAHMPLGLRWQFFHQKTVHKNICTHRVLNSSPHLGFYLRCIYRSYFTFCIGVIWHFSSRNFMKII